MIALKTTTIAMLYLGLTLFLLLGLWIYHYFSKQKKGEVVPAEVLCMCEYCQFVYLADSGTAVNRCPQCQTLNKDNLYKS